MDNNTNNKIEIITLKGSNDIYDIHYISINNCNNNR